MRTKKTAAWAVLVVAASTWTAGTAEAGGLAASTVTIRAEGVDLSGTVSSPRPARCADGRKVIVYKQRGARGGGDDRRIASDTAERQGDRYVWSTGNTGIEGRFYSKVRRTDQCRGDTSRTIRAVRNP